MVFFNEFAFEEQISVASGQLLCQFPQGIVKMALKTVFVGGLLW
jgi:hypothetical protein